MNKPQYRALLFLLCLPLLFASCNEEEEIVTSDYCYISSFTLGSLKRQIHTLSSTGQDSVYTVTITGGLFPMSINQKTLTIENVDSLPYGTKVDRVLTTVSYTGAALVHRLASAEENAEWTGYETKDSVDFTAPRKYAVLSSDGSSVRYYTVKLNVHKQQSDATTWTKMDEEAALGQFIRTKAVTFAHTLWLYGENTTGLHLMKRSLQAADKGWTEVGTTIPANADIKTLTATSAALYVSTTDGETFTSTDGASWTGMGSAHEGLQLVGASEHKLYAILGGSLQSSEDASTWTPETLDASTDLLPQHEAQAVHYLRENGNHRLTLIGNSGMAPDAPTRIWAKSWYESGARTPETSAGWMYYPVASNAKNTLPHLSPLHAFYYDDKLMCTGSTLDKVYASRDHGITWKPSDEIQIPKELQGNTVTSALAVDEDGFIWIVAGNQVWRGRLNRIGFDRKDR